MQQGGANEIPWENEKRTFCSFFCVRKKEDKITQCFVVVIVHGGFSYWVEDTVDF